MLEARERLRQAFVLAGHLARPGTAACLPSHELTPFDQLLHFKLLIEHYYELPTFQPRASGEEEAGSTVTGTETAGRPPYAHSQPRGDDAGAAFARGEARRAAVRLAVKREGPPSALTAPLTARRREPARAVTADTTRPSQALSPVTECLTTASRPLSASQRTAAVAPPPRPTTPATGEEHDGLLELRWPRTDGVP
jgi:hypothetical protein